MAYKDRSRGSWVVLNYKQRDHYVVVSKYKEAQSGVSFTLPQAQWTTPDSLAWKLILYSKVYANTGEISETTAGRRRATVAENLKATGRSGNYGKIRTAFSKTPLTYIGDIVNFEAGGQLDAKHDNKSHFPSLTAEIRQRVCVHLELGFEPVSSPWNIFVEVMVVEVWSIQVSPRQLRQCANWTASEFPCFARAQ